MVRATASSLPGIGEAETMTVSPGSMVMLRWSRLLMRVSPDIGSPCEPVVMTTSSSLRRRCSWSLRASVSPRGSR